jgi:NAD(P)-dependent dehydrogenase (short-subunit alcohol dehydrogenase family)
MRVFITGISSGLGEGIAHAALRSGAEVWGISRNPPDKSFSVYRERIRYLSLDLADAEAGAPALEKWVDGVDHWDQVWLNAGILPPFGDLADTSLGTLRATLDVNLLGNHWLLSVLRKGATLEQVVAISSGASISGHRGWNAYGISKAALNMWVQLMAVETPATHFTAMAPGLIDTAMQDYLTALTPDERYPTVDRLKAAKGTDAMPDGAEVGERLWTLAPRLCEEYPSGSYLDLRRMSAEG